MRMSHAYFNLPARSIPSKMPAPTTRRKKLSLWQDIAPIQKDLQKLPDDIGAKEVIADNLNALPGLVKFDCRLMHCTS